MPPLCHYLTNYSGDRNGLTLPPHYALTLMVLWRVSNFGLPTTLENTMLDTSVTLELTCIGAKQHRHAL